MKLTNFVRKRNAQARGGARMVSVLLSLLAAFTVLPCFLTYAASSFVIDRVIVRDYTRDYLDMLYTNVQNGVNDYLFQLNALCASLTTDRRLYNIWLETAGDERARGERVRAFLGGYLRDDSLISNADVVYGDNRVIRYKEETLSPIAGDFRARITPANAVIYNDVVKNADGDSFLVIGKRVFDFKTGYYLGYIYLYINERAFAALYGESGAGEFYIASGGRVLSQNDSANVGRLLISGALAEREETSYQSGGSHVFSKSLTVKTGYEEGLRFISVISYDYLRETYRNLRAAVATVVLLALLISVVLTVLIARLIARPVNGLKARMEHFVQGSAREGRAKYKELASLEHSFDAMVSDIEELIDKNNREQEKQRRAEIKALQAQINPHFVYNTLDSIQWYARKQSQQYIADMLHALASFFRIGLHKGDATIKVSEEITHVKSYIQIEQMRFPELFEVIYEVDDDILDCDIPKIILQPLVENSIKHGFDDRYSGGVIIIRGRRDGEDILFEVEDNGAGLNANPLGDKGFGARNVHERLALAYGEGYGLEYLPAPTGGTLVRIRLKPEG